MASDTANRADWLPYRLARHAAVRPDAVAFRFLKRPGSAASEITWVQLWADALATTERLALSGGVGQRIAIACEAPRDFVVALACCLISGSVAVPLPVSLSRRSAPRATAILRAALPGVVVISPNSSVADWLVEAETAAQAVEVARLTPLPPRIAEPEITDDPDAPELIQFTSGSTGKPRGIALSHANIAANCRAIAAAYGLSRDTRGLSWLPLHHDMGLVGHVLTPFWLGCRSALVDPLQFLQQPLNWLRLVKQERATITSAPNFAYEICSKVAPADTSEFDLASLTTAVCGGEPVLPATVRRFIATFAPAGFRSSAFAPSYGLAEATLLVASGRKPSGPVFVEVMVEGEAVREVADLGPPVAGLLCRMIDEAGAEVPDGALGELEIAGDSVGQILGEPLSQFVRTGDLGFFRNGRLHIAGRKKELIILRGQNVYPSDVEAAAMEAHPSIAPGGVAAIGIEAGGTQRLVIVVEIERKKSIAREELARLRQRVSEQVAKRVGHVPDQVIVQRFGTLPRTSSGKIKRGELAVTLSCGDIDDASSTTPTETTAENI